MKETCNNFAKGFEEQIKVLKSNGSSKNTNKNKRNLKCKNCSQLNSMVISKPIKQDIIDILNQMKVKISAGYDGIQMKHLIETKENIPLS